MKEAIDEFLSFLKEDNSYDRKRYHRTHISSNDSCGSRDHNRYDEDPNGEYVYLDNNPDGSCSVPRDKYILRDKYLANKDTYDAQYPRTPTDWAGYEKLHGYEPGSATDEYGMSRVNPNQINILPQYLSMKYGMYPTRCASPIPREITHKQYTEFLNEVNKGLFEPITESPFEAYISVGNISYGPKQYYSGDGPLSIIVMFINEKGQCYSLCSMRNPEKVTKETAIQGVIDGANEFLNPPRKRGRKAQFKENSCRGGGSCGINAAFPHNDNETDSSLQTVKEFLKTAKPRLHESCDAHGGCGMWYDDKEKQVEEPHSCCEGMPIC